MKSFQEMIDDADKIHDPKAYVGILVENGHIPNQLDARVVEGRGPRRIRRPFVFLGR